MKHLLSINLLPKVILFGFLVIPLGTLVQNQFLSERIPVLKKYDADHLLQVALPIGGIGTGIVTMVANAIHLMKQNAAITTQEQGLRGRIFLAQSGFHCSALYKSIQFRRKEGLWFWSNGSAWGSCNISQENGNWIVVLEVLHGKLSINSFRLGETIQHQFKKEMVIKEGSQLKVELGSQ